MAALRFETDRLVLRKFEDSDVGALYQLLIPVAQEHAKP